MLLPNSPAEWNVEFFNIAFSANIDSQKFSPEKILEIVKKIEKNLGRKEREKWSPREIDIDILAIGNLRINLGKKLTIPHLIIGILILCFYTTLYFFKGAAFTGFSISNFNIIGFIFLMGNRIKRTYYVGNVWYEFILNYNQFCNLF